MRVAKVDMSARAVAARIEQVSQLRNLCLSLAKAGKGPQGERASSSKSELR